MPTRSRAVPTHVSVSVDLDDHLCDALPPQSFTAHESLPFQPCNAVAYSGDHQENSCRNETRCGHNDTQELEYGHDGVDGAAHVIGCEATDEGVESR